MDNNDKAASSNRAVFLDRDGVLIRDTHLLTDIAQVEILPGVPLALEKLRAAGYTLITVTNQPVISRGLTDLTGVEAVNNFINSSLGGIIEHFYVCPHHPKADREEYRQDCPCRKPKPGMLLQGAADYKINLRQSWMIGDRISDVLAGLRAGCRTIQLQTGAHTAPPHPIPLNAR